MPITESKFVKDIPEFLKEAREAYDFALKVDKQDSDSAKADNIFANASDELKEQWETTARDKRIKDRRPVLQWNRIAVSVQQVVNAGRQNKPSIRVSAGDGGKKETADYYQSRIRHLEYDCNADTARDTARNQQVTSGRGFIRYSVEFIPGTFEQRITIEPIENQFSVVWDPSARLYDRSDADWWMVLDWISREKHIREYGADSVVTHTDFTRDDNPAPGWFGVGKSNELIQVAQYWKKHYVDRTLALLGSGDPGGMEIAIWEDQVPEELRHRIVRRRQDKDVTIACYIINGAEILKESEWIGSSIPIVPVWGRTEVVDGERRTFSLIRNAKDPQRSLNFYVSNIVEMIAMMPKTPWLAPIGAIPAHMEVTYRDVGGVPVGFLLWQEWEEGPNGVRQLSKPERVIQDAPVQALTAGALQCIDAIKAAMGIYDSQLGAAKAEYSGISVTKRLQQGEITNFHFTDNESRSRKREGEILLELIRKLDKPGKSYPVRSESGEVKLVPFGTPHLDEKSGETITHDHSGDYGLVVASGPSYTTARKEAYDRDAALIQALPESAFIIGDLMFEADDTAGAQDRAERWKKAIQAKSPNLIPPDPKKQQAPDPEQLQQAVQQLQTKLATTSAFAQKLHEDIQSKQPELENAIKLKQMDLDFQREKLAADEALGLAKLGIQADIKSLESQIAAIRHEHQLVADAQAQQADQAHQAAMQQGQQDHSQQMQGADQDHAQDLQAGQQAHEAGQNQADRDAAAQQQQNQPLPEAA